MFYTCPPMEHHLTYRQKFCQNSRKFPKKVFFLNFGKKSHFMEKVHDLLRGNKIRQTQNFVKKGWIDREIKCGDSIGATRLDRNSTRNRCPKSSVKIRNENFRPKFSIKILAWIFGQSFSVKFFINIWSFRIFVENDLFRTEYFKTNFSSLTDQWVIVFRVGHVIILNYVMIEVMMFPKL